jgi:hypothetical protein
VGARDLLALAADTGVADSAPLVVRSSFCRTGHFPLRKLPAPRAPRR